MIFNHTLFLDMRYITKGIGINQFITSLFLHYTIRMPRYVIMCQILVISIAKEYTSVYSECSRIYIAKYN